MEESNISSIDSLRISITSFCNMKCSYCHNEGNKKASILKKEQIESIIDNCKLENLETIRLTGGEPILVEEIEDICKMITSEKGLNVEINTNGIEISKLLKLIEKKYIKKVVVGLDYFDGKVSKNSLIGQSSEIIKNNIIKIKKRNCEVCIDTVYNGENENIKKLIEWAIEKNIQIRIIERVKEQIDEEYSKEYEEMKEFIKDKIKLDWIIEDEMNELCGYKDGVLFVQFYHSLCRFKLCDVCKKELFRVTSDGVLKDCLFSD